MSRNRRGSSSKDGWRQWSSGGTRYVADYKKDDDYVLVDFESPSVVNEPGKFIDFAPGAAFSQGGFKFQAVKEDFSLTPEVEEKDELLISSDSEVGFTGSGIVQSEIDAIEKLSFLGNGKQPNQGLAPHCFSPDLLVTYFEDEGYGKPAEREDFRFKGLYASGFTRTDALDAFELTFIGFRDGKIVDQFTTMATSGGFIRSRIEGKIDALLIRDGSPDVDFVIDNVKFEV